MEPWLEGWTKRFAIVIDADLIDEDLSWVPITLFLNEAAGLTEADLTPIFDEVGANKLKIAVTKSDGVTQLYVEIDTWDEVAEEAVLHVSKSDWTVTDATGTVLYIYFDATHADNTDYVGVTGSTPGKAVWNDAFVMVQHMNDDPDSSHIKDSTQYENHGTKKAANEPVETAGAVGLAQDFDGVDDYVDVADSSELNLGTNDFLVSEWIKLNGSGDIIAKGVNENFKIKVSGNKLWVILDGEDTLSFPTLGIYNDGTYLYITDTYNHRLVKRLASDLSYNWVLSSLYATHYSSPLNAEWHDIIVKITHNSPDVTITTYIDSVLDLSTTTATYCYLSNSDSLFIGGTLNNFNGTIDEVRISNARSAAWIAATNLSLTDALVEWGPLQTLCECECSDVLVHTDTNAPTVIIDGECSDIVNQSDVEAANVEGILEIGDTLRVQDTPSTFVSFMVAMADYLKSSDTPSLQLVIDGVIMDIVKGSDAATIAITADVSAAEIIKLFDKTFGIDAARVFTMNGKTLTFTLN